MIMKHFLLIINLLFFIGLGSAFAEEPENMPPRGKMPRGERHEDKREKMMDKLRQADTNRDGAISRDEANKSLPHLAKNFDKIDENHDGLITREELQHFREKRMQHRIDRGRTDPRP